MRPPTSFPASWSDLPRPPTRSEELILQSERHPWEDKAKVAFFRGSRTSGERDPLVLLSRCDAGPRAAAAASLATPTPQRVPPASHVFGRPCV